MNNIEQKYSPYNHDVDYHGDVIDKIPDHGQILQYYTHPVSGLSGTVGTSGVGWYSIDGADLVNISNYEMSFNSGEKDFTEMKLSYYSTVASFLFEGTHVWNPKHIFLVISRQTDKTSYSHFRIWDYTNQLVVCEVSWTNYLRHSLEINEEGLSNLSYGQAIWELQLKSTSDSKARIHYISVR